MAAGRLIGLAIGIFILTPLLNRLLRNPTEKFPKRHGYDLNGKKIEPSLRKEPNANGATGFMPRAGDVFEGTINDLSQYDSKGWRRRDITFINYDVKQGLKFGYPTQRDRIILLDSDGNRYKLNFSEPEKEDRVCLGTPSKLKPWYQKKGFEYRSVNTNDKIYFEYTGHEVEFYVFTEGEYLLKKGDTACAFHPHVNPLQEDMRMTWKCPECGTNNNEDIAKCTCGYDANRPFTFNPQRAKESEGNVSSFLKGNEKRMHPLNGVKTLHVSRNIKCRKCNFSGVVEAHDTGGYPREKIFKNLGKDTSGFLHFQCPECGADEAYSPYSFLGPGFKFGCLAFIVLAGWLIFKLLF